MPGRHYSDTEKRTAVSWALILGPKEAGRQLKIPGRTVSVWWRSPRWVGDIDPDTRSQLGSLIFETMSEAIVRLKAKIKDPHVSVMELARAVETLRDSHNLLLNKATANVAVASYSDSMPPTERRALLGYLDSLLVKLDAGLLDEVENEVALQLQCERSIDRLLASGEAATPEEAARMITAPVIEGSCAEVPGAD
jgi:hypothetical protein